MSSEEKKEQYFLSYIDDLITASEDQNISKYSDFLNEKEQSDAISVLKRRGAAFQFSGGYPNAERKMLCILNGGSAQFPICTLLLTAGQAVGHRDILGSLLALGIKREVLGDIVMLSDTRAAFFVKDAISSYLIAHCDRAGRTSCRVQQTKDPIRLPEQKLQQFSITVASDRLDCVVSELVRLSREKSTNLIKEGRVFVNQANIDNPSRKVKQGDKISIRGYGKFLLDDETGLTKKGRIKRNVFKY